MNLFKSKIVSWVIFSIMIFALAACGTSNKAEESPKDTEGTTPITTPANPAEDSKKEPAKPELPKPVDISIYSNNVSTEERFNQQYGDALRAKFPHITFTFISSGGAGTMIGEVIAAKTPVDIMYGSVETIFSHVMDFDMQLDLSDLIKANNYDVSKIEPTMIELQRNLSGGKLYGLPVWTATSGLFYNIDLFEKFGQDVPKEGLTWDELGELAKIMTRKDGDVQYYGYVTSAGAQMATNQLSMDPIDPITMKSNFNSEPWKQFMQSIVDIFTTSGHTYTKEDLDVATSRGFFEKDMIAAMYTNYSGGTPPETMNWDVVSVPSYSSAPGIGSQVYPNYWYVTGISKHKDVAFEILTYLTSEEFQSQHNRKGFATVLTNSEIKKQYGQDMAKFHGKNVEALFPKQPAKPMQYTTFARAAQSAFQQAFYAHMLEGKDLNTALREAAEQVDKQIEEAKAR